MGDQLGPHIYYFRDTSRCFYELTTKLEPHLFRAMDISLFANLGASSVNLKNSMVLAYDAPQNDRF